MNYIGSKYSLLDFLKETIYGVTGFREGSSCVFADLFAGTGAVGRAFKTSGCFVIANDIQYYSYCLNRHYIENVPVMDESLLEHFNSLTPVEGFVYHNYCSGSGCGRNYFSDENGMLCDAVRSELERLRTRREIDEGTYFFYLASLIDSIDKYANTASVYGAFLKHLKKTARKRFRLELLPVIGGKRGEVCNEDISRLIGRISGDVLYLDPPYNARQYCANYHVLETIARYDDPKLYGVSGLRDSSLQKSRFCSKKTVVQVFDELIAKADFKYIFLSYNNEGLMGLDTIKEVMSGYGRYSFFTTDYRRFQADRKENRSIGAHSTTEYLHCLIKG